MLESPTFEEVVEHFVDAICDDGANNLFYEPSNNLHVFTPFPCAGLEVTAVMWGFYNGEKIFSMKKPSLGGVAEIFLS